MTAPLAAPPYALASVEFPCPGLASLAARATVGAGRELVLACMIAARLAIAAGPPLRLSQELRRERSEGARAWISTLNLEPAKRAVVLQATNASWIGTPREIAAELENMANAFATVLDQPAAADLARIAERLRR